MDRQALQERFGILGDSAALRRVLDRVRQVAGTDITVLLEGESGVGKELIATALHGLSARRHKRLVVVNCGAIPEGLIESELFGAEKGAYTGATSQRTGFFEEADGGTIFLDEIGEMPSQAQVRLLRVIESGQFSRVGSSQVQHADVRILAATNKNLAEEVRKGAFREDLYYRLSAVIIQVPPLRERSADILPLFEAFAHRTAQQYDAQMPELEPSAEDLLQRYNWPGNVRELRNVAEQAVVLSAREPLTAKTIRPYLRGVSAAEGLTVARPAFDEGGGRGAADAVRERELLYRALLEMRVEMRHMRELLTRLVDGASIDPDAIPAGSVHSESERSLAEAKYADFSEPPSSGTTYHDVDYEEVPSGFADVTRPGPETPAAGGGRAVPSSLEEALADGLPLPTIENAERVLILEALDRYEGNRRRTAEALGISERTLYRKIKSLEAEGHEV